MQNKHRLPFPLIKSGMYEKWAFCVNKKITPITRPTQKEDWEDVHAVHQPRTVAHMATRDDR